ncbi:glycosyltransferase family 2 protein [Sulfuricaulis sp.]|jgi:glycosyltransferase involved in cell wall biosynthesis|uniref:glycosyltransferase family 2 protein n=1 Tax=Sulfuricaulis sp. TaxID=2003553 RepID=UPI00355A1581
MPQNISIIIPAKNEYAGLCVLLPALRKNHPTAEIIVVNDGSSDDTAKVCTAHDVVLLSHPYNIGNGAAIKSGARNATGDILVFMDADGQHNPDDIPRLLSKYNEGHDMVVGARHSSSQASLGRSYANRIYNWLASWMVGRKIDDLTSGFRVATATKFREFIYLLPNGFSYPTTITMSFFRAGYPVAYVPIQAKARQGKSHINPLRDGVRFLIIIFKVGTLYSPLKLFAPISLVFFATGISYYVYTYLTYTRFTNMSALLLITSILIFLIGLVSEQITTLVYKDSGHQ